MQGDHRPEVPGGGHHRQAGEHHLQARLQAELSAPCRARSTASSRRGSSPSWRRRSAPRGSPRSAASRDARATTSWPTTTGFRSRSPTRSCGSPRQLMNEPDEERWARRFGESFMDWKPREERSYLGTYSMGIGASARRVRAASRRSISQQSRFYRLEVLEVGRRRARYRWTPAPRATGCRSGPAPGSRRRSSASRPTGACRAPAIIESTCAARGDDACRWEVRWKNPSLGRPLLAAQPGGRGRVDRSSACWTRRPAAAGRSRRVTPLPLLAGVALGYCAPRGAPAPPHPAAPRSAVRGDHLLEPRAREEVRRARDPDRAALAPHRPERGGERHPRSREDLRPGPRPARPPHGLPARAPLPGGPRAPACCAATGWRAPIRRAVRSRASSCRSTPRPARARRAAVTGAAGARQRRGARDRSPSTGDLVRAHRVAQLRRRAAAGARPGLRGAHRDASRSRAASTRATWSCWPRWPTTWRSPSTRPRASRPSRSCPAASRTRCGSAPSSCGPPTRSCGAPTAICRPPSCSSSSARRWPRSASSWRGSPTSSNNPIGFISSNVATLERLRPAPAAHARGLPGRAAARRRPASGSQRAEGRAARWTTRSSTSTRCSQGIREGADRTRKIVARPPRVRPHAGRRVAGGRSRTRSSSRASRC